MFCNYPTWDDDALMATGNLLVLIGKSTANDGFQIAMFGVQEDIPYGSLWIIDLLLQA